MSQTPNRKRSQIFCHQVKSTLSNCQHLPLTGYSLAGRRLRWSVVSQIGREELMAALRVSGLLCRHHPLMARILSAQDSVCSNNLIPPLLSGKRTLPTKVPRFHRKISDLCRLNVLIEHVGCKTFSFRCEAQYIFLLVSCVKCLSTFSLGAQNRDASYEVYTM